MASLLSSGCRKYSCLLSEIKLNFTARHPLHPQVVFLNKEAPSVIHPIPRIYGQSRHLDLLVEHLWSEWCLVAVLVNSGPLDEGIASKLVLLNWQETLQL